MSETRYARLVKITQIINSNFELNSVLEQVVTAISDEIIYCDSVGIYLPQEDGTFRGYIGKPNDFNGITIDQMVVDPQCDLLAKEIIDTRKSIYIPDTSLDPRPDRRPVELFDIKSILGLPLTYNHEIFGLVFLFNYGTPMHLADEEIQAVESYVNMAAVALRNSRLFQNQQAVLAEKQLLLDATRDLARCSTMKEVLDTSFSYLGRATGNTNIGVHLCDAIGKSFRPAQLNAGSDWREEDWMKTHKKIRLNYDKDLLFQDVITNRKAVFIPDIEADPRPNKDACHKFGIKAIFMLPLVATREVLGTIAIVSLGKAHAYTEAQMQLAQSIVDATAIALSNAIHTEQLELIIKARTAEILQKNGMLEQIVDELKLLDHMKNQVFASVSHELRTPLTAVRGSVELLKMGLMGPLTTEQQELVDMAEQGIDRLLHKLNDLLDLAKIENGHFSVKKAESDYSNIVQRTLDIVTPLFSKKGQSLELKLSDIPNLQIDSDRIEQVLLNLLVNANKFTPAKGSITVYVEATDEGVLTCVEDSGIGIPEEELDKIFLRFYQLKQHQQEKTSDTGLGLSIAKQIVEYHGGDMWAESEEHMGSRFYFVLPIH